MTDGDMLRDKINSRGTTITYIANKMGCSRNRIYSILSGDECVASEIVQLSDILRLTKPERDKIFLQNNVNKIH